MHYISEFLTIALIDFLAIVSPGAAWVLIIRNGLAYSRRIVIYSSIGLGLGIAVDIIVCLAGTSFLTTELGVYFFVIKYLGVAYLCYLGFVLLTDRSRMSASRKIPGSVMGMTAASTIRMGIITNVTNINAYLFFLSLFTLVVSHTTPLAVKAVYGIEMSIAESVWFIILGSFISHGYIKKRLENFQRVIEKILGIILLALAVKIAFS